MKLETIGRVLAGGFGDKVLIGILTGLLDGISPARAYEYIRDNLELGYWVSDSNWSRYRRMAQGANIKDVTGEDIIKELRKHRTDILSVIINTPGGRDWFDRQVVGLKKKLGLD